MKRIVLLFTLLFVFAVDLSAQIELGTKTTKESNKKSEKSQKENGVVKPKKERKGTLGEGKLSVYLGFAPTYSFRNLSSNDNVFGEELGTRNNEKPAWVYSGNIGVRANLHKYVTLDISLGYLEDGESYSYNSSINDSSYSYKNSFRNFGINFKVYGRYQVGRFSFYAGGGIGPSLFINQGQKLKYTNSFGGNKQNEKRKLTEGFNAFNLHVMGSAGVSFQVFDFMSVYFIPEYRYGIFSSYSKQAEYIRKPIGLSLHFGLTVDF